MRGIYSMGKTFQFLNFLLFASVVQALAIEPITLAAIIGAGSILASGGIGIFSSSQAAGAQTKENRKTRLLNLEIHKENLAEAKKQFAKEHSLAKKQFKSSQARQNFEMTQVVGQNFTKMMNDNPNVANSFFQIAANRGKKLPEKGVL